MKRDSIDWKIIDRETISRGGSIEARMGGNIWLDRIDKRVFGAEVGDGVFHGASKIRRPKNRARRKLVGSWNIGGDSAERSREKFDTGWTKLSSPPPFSVSFRRKIRELRSPRAFQWIREGGRLRISIYISLIRGREALFKSSCFLLIFLYG